jgi:DNA invertase Pin-like site-specific DNA recombinase
MPKKRERAAIYVRESDIGLATDSTTMESAMNAIRQYCLKEEYIVEPTHEYREAISGFSVPYFQRPELMKVLKAAERKEFDVLVITEVRALSRKGAGEVFLIYEALQKAGCRLETISEKFSDSPVGELVLSWKATYARLEREQSYLRMQRGKADRVAIGKAPNGHAKPVYGYIFVDTDKEAKGAYAFNHTIIYVDSKGREWSEYKVMCYIFDLLRSGESLHATARILNELGIPPRCKAKTGEPHWNASALRNLISHPIYHGEVWANRFRRYEKQNKKGEMKMLKMDRPREEWIRLPDAPAMIDPQVHEALLLQVAANRQESLRNNKHDTSELGLVRAGYCRCSVCGRAMVVEYPSELQQSKGSTPGYRCRQTSSSKQGYIHNHNTSIRLSLVDTAVRKKIMEVLKDTAWVRARVAELRKVEKPLLNEEAIKETVAKLQVELDNLFDLARYATSDKNRERLGLMMQDIERQQREAEGMQFDLSDIEAEQAEIEAEIVKFETWVAKVKPNLTNPHYMETASYDELRLAVRILGIVVIVDPAQANLEMKERCDIKVTVPAVLGKIEKKSSVSHEPTFRSPVAGLPLRHWK